MTTLTIPVIDDLVADLKAAVRDVLTNPESSKGTMTTIYGLGSTPVVGPGLVSQMVNIFVETLSVAFDQVVHKLIAQVLDRYHV